MAEFIVNKAQIGAIDAYESALNAYGFGIDTDRGVVSAGDATVEVADNVSPHAATSPIEMYARQHHIDPAIAAGMYSVALANGRMF